MTHSAVHSTAVNYGQGATIRDLYAMPLSCYWIVLLYTLNDVLQFISVDPTHWCRTYLKWFYLKFNLVVDNGTMSSVIIVAALLYLTNMCSLVFLCHLPM